MIMPRMGLPIAVAMMGYGLNMILTSPSLPGSKRSLTGRGVIAG